MFILAIESSTSSAKAVLYDTENGIASSRQHVYGRAIDHGGMTDPQRVFELCMKTGRETAEGRKVDMIALCGTWHGICICDREKRPVSPVYSWNFTGSSGYCRKVRADEALRSRLYTRTGCMPHNTYPRDTLAYLRSEGMELSDKTFMTQGGYNFFRMTGCFLESVSTQSGSGLIELSSRMYDPFVMEYLGVSKNQFGQLSSWRDTRPLLKEAADLLGLPEGIPVVPAHPDGALNQIGNYAQRPGVMTLSVGTSGALRLTTQKPVLPEGQELWCYCGAEGWISGAAAAGACNCIDWFVKDMLCSRFSYEELEQMYSTEMPEGRNIPVFLPFLYGERCPGWHDERSGGFAGLGPGMSAGALYLAVQAGILFNLYQCYQVLCREEGVPDKIYVSGGITNSGRWMQMLSDIFGREICAAAYPNASTMGAVALAMCAQGEIASLADFSEGEALAHTISPDPEATHLYRLQYKRYLEAYEEQI